MESEMPATIPCLWFDGQAEQAATQYTGLFPNSRVDRVTPYGPGMPGPEGTAMTVDFTLDGQHWLGLNGGPQFTFTEAISFQIMCADQEEVDHYWDGLSEGGTPGPCGWLKDRFGVSWQVVPTALPLLMQDPDAGRAARATQAMMGMGKLVIADLYLAADGTAS